MLGRLGQIAEQILLSLFRRFIVVIITLILVAAALFSAGFIFIIRALLVFAAFVFAFVLVLFLLAGLGLGLGQILMPLEILPDSFSLEDISVS